MTDHCVSIEFPYRCAPIISSIVAAFSEYLSESAININFLRGFIAVVTPKIERLNGIFESLQNWSMWQHAKEYRLNSRIINTLIAIIDPLLRTKICNDCMALIGSTEFVSQTNIQPEVFAACSLCKNCAKLYHQDCIPVDSSIYDGIAAGLLIVYSRHLKQIVPEPLLSIPSRFKMLKPDIVCSYDIVPSHDCEWPCDAYEFHDDVFDSDCEDDDNNYYYEKFSIAVKQMDGSILTCTLYNDNLYGSYYWLAFTQKKPVGADKTLGIMRWDTVKIDQNECDAQFHAEFEGTSITFGQHSTDGECLSLHVVHCWRILCFIGRLLSQGGKFVAQPTALCIVDHTDQCAMKISGSIVEWSEDHPTLYIDHRIYNELWLTVYVPDNQTRSIGILKSAQKIYNKSAPPFRHEMIVKARSAKAEASCLPRVSAIRLAWVSSVVRIAGTRTISCTFCVTDDKKSNM